MQDATFLFTDIEGSTRLWEAEPERMRVALARHDAIAREAVEAHGGRVVKMLGDGVHAVFEDAAGAVLATLQLQRGMSGAEAALLLPLHVRCGLHRGASEGRDGDFYGSTVNRAARLMGAAWGGQVLVSRAVVESLEGRAPEGVTFHDLGTIRLRDLASPEGVCQLVHPQLRKEFPALRSLSDTPNNLRQDISTFIGRERELADLAHRLREHRLVTVIGMGGIGKTRLAIHAAAQTLERFRDGAWLVELEPLTEGWHVEHAVAAALGLREEPGRPMAQTLREHLRLREILLVLDNAEHLLEPVARLVRALLESSPGLRLLVTSREPLRMAGEAVLPVVGLQVPTPRDLLSAAGTHHFAAIRLFVERAKAAAPAFELDSDTSDDVAAICHRLDGIPLAIELAAARVRSMPVDVIAARLKEHFRWLSSRDPSTTPRQRTLDALINWSYELLPAGERELFLRLSVFQGGWDLASAEAVCGEGVAHDVDDAIAQLVEKSLVVADPATRRARMLEAVREFAQQRLDRVQASAARARHFAHFLRLATQAKPHLSGSGQSEWTRRLDQERDNILAAVEWAAGVPALAIEGLRLVNALKMYFIARGLLAIGLRATEDAMHRLAEDADAEDFARGAFNAGQYLYYMGRYDEARPWLERSVALARKLGHPQALLGGLCRLGVTAAGQGDVAFAREVLGEAVELGEASGQRGNLAVALNSLALLHRIEGRHADARALYERVAALLADSGNAEARATALVTLAMTHVEAGDARSAGHTLEDALDLMRQDPSILAAQSALEACAGLASLKGDHRFAARLLGTAGAIARDSGLARDPADERFFAHATAHARRVLGAVPFDAEREAGAGLVLAAALAQARSHLREPADQDLDLTSRQR